ncbi:hypothetical protein E4U03_03295 [Rothia nasimurium]|uniref:Uncharacterized protein n=1 Tax=Rothia nasimurium TaxID=85336 RepID=A0A4Y9F528_9MICC|nr:hypothetical protein [Rothia nasimurium]MBF0807643.1 hypothetical protein [Rothia nasimurium]TFU23379.1 hypothetical protein E4U03_03295 [Rothia nasimurium]
MPAETTLWAMTHTHSLTPYETLSLLVIADNTHILIDGSFSKVKKSYIAWNMGLSEDQVAVALSGLEEKGLITIHKDYMEVHDDIVGVKEAYVPKE